MHVCYVYINVERRRQTGLLLQCLPMTQKRNVTRYDRANHSFESVLLIESVELVYKDGEMKAETTDKKHSLS